MNRVLSFILSKCDLLHIFFACLETYFMWVLFLFFIYLFFLKGCPNQPFFFNFLYCSGFCITLKWNSHGFTCVPHPNPRSHLPLHPIPLGLPSTLVRALVSCIQPGLVICFTLDNIRFDAVLLKHPTLAFSHRL